MFCKFYFYFRALFLTISHDFRIVQYVPAKSKKQNGLEFRFCCHIHVSYHNLRVEYRFEARFIATCAMFPFPIPCSLIIPLFLHTSPSPVSPFPTSTIPYQKGTYVRFSIIHAPFSETNVRSFFNSTHAFFRNERTFAFQ